MEDRLRGNAQDLTSDLEWFAQILDTRLKLYLGDEKKAKYKDIFDIKPPELSGDSLYASFIDYYEVSFAERLALLLALTPHIRPQLLQAFFDKEKVLEKELVELGGIKGEQYRGYLPTGETLAFILTGDNLEARFSLTFLFDRDHYFAQHNVLRLEPVKDGEPALSGALKISHEFLDYFTTGLNRKPDFGINFPAKHIYTELEWEDLVLETSILKQIEEIKAWMEYGDVLMNDWDLGKKLRPGYRALFYGPPGTGKTMTACLLGKATNRDVYKVDLSMVVSKYIGETEKNLSKVFEQAENKNWILFFDEADALFGKRTKVEDAHDRYANQEVSYLLQRIEVYNGLVILASNMKANLDDAFARRFESMIYFPMPKPSERLNLWENGFSSASTLEGNVQLKQLADKYELSGGAIMNVVRYSSLMALKKQSNEISLADLESGIRKEYHKEGKTA